MQKSLLRARMRQKINMEPPDANQVYAAQSSIDVLMNECLLTVRRKIAVTCYLDEIAKEIEKDVQPSLSSDAEFEILEARIESKFQKELECGNVNDNALTDEEKDELKARIVEFMNSLAQKVSSFAYRVLGSMIMEQFANI